MCKSKCKSKWLPILAAFFLAACGEKAEVTRHEYMSVKRFPDGETFLCAGIGGKDKCIKISEQEYVKHKITMEARANQARLIKVGN